jgi:predicted NUDIX family NTP pyrophosphohydrolase
MGRRRARQKESAGLLMFRRPGGLLQVLLAHPGGPFWASRDEGALTIPKGGIHPGEGPLDAAIREFGEETGFAPAPPFLELGHVVQRSGKVVYAWAFEGDADPSRLTSTMTHTEWPRKSGKWISVPEIDRAEFFEIADAERRINPAQVVLLDRLKTIMPTA